MKPVELELVVGIRVDLGLFEDGLSNRGRIRDKSLSPRANVIIA